MIAGICGRKVSQLILLFQLVGSSGLLIFQFWQGAFNREVTPAALMLYVGEACSWHAYLTQLQPSLGREMIPKQSSKAGCGCGGMCSTLYPTHTARLPCLAPAPPPQILYLDPGALLQVRWACRFFRGSSPLTCRGSWLLPPPYLCVLHLGVNLSSGHGVMEHSGITLILYESIAVSLRAPPLWLY